MMQGNVYVAVLDVIMVADIMSNPRVFWRIGSPVLALIARRLSERHFTQLDDKGIARRRIVRVVFVGRGLRYPKLHMRRIGIKSVCAAQRHGADLAHRIDNVGGRVTTERDEVRHAVRLVFQTVDLHFAGRSVRLHAKRDPGLEPEHACLAGL